MFSSLSRRWFGIASRPSSARRPFRPAVEGLEDRRVPAVGAEIHVNSFTEGNQAESDNAFSSNGTAVAVWVRQYTSTNSQIRAQRYDARGRRLGGEILVATTATHKTAPDVAIDRAGNFVVVWADGRDPRANHDVKGQRVAANGQKLGGLFTVSATAVDERTPSVAMDAAGNYVVAFAWDKTAAPQTLGDYVTNVSARLYRADGALTKSVLVAAGGNLALNPDVFRAADGRFAVAYQDAYDDGGMGGPTSDVVVKRYTPAGVLGALHRVPKQDTRRGYQGEWTPKLSGDDRGNLVVGYQYNQYVGAFSTFQENRFSVRAVTITAAGAMSPVRVISAVTSGPADLTDVAMSRANGSFVVALHAPTAAGRGAAVIEMTFGGAVLRRTALGAQRGQTAVSTGPNNRYFVTYTSLVSRPDDPGLGIYGRWGVIGA